MIARVAVCLILSALGAVCGDWSLKLAAQYLDGRQKEWFAWPKANAGAKPCISCHTGMTYLLARPALRKALGESEPTPWETGLLASLRDRVGKQEPPGAASLGVESVMAALFLSSDASGTQALDRLWVLQSREGKNKGAWNWFNLDLDPWEMPASNFFGASLAAMAMGGAPDEYRARPEVKEHIASLIEFLRSAEAGQTLHNRLMLLWCSRELPEALTPEARREIVAAAWKQQQPDGAWTLDSLGPFKIHEKAVPQPGSNAYATAFAAFVLGATEGATPKLDKALAWLRAHQDRETGYWSAHSMNHAYPEGSMESGFMNDAATAFASLALLHARGR